MLWLTVRVRLWWHHLACLPLLTLHVRTFSSAEHVKWRTCQLLCVRVCVWVPHTHTLLLRFIWMIKMCASSECCMRTNLMTIAGVYQHHCAAALGLVDPGPHGCLWWRITSACPLSQLQQREGRGRTVQACPPGRRGVFSSLDSSCLVVC